MTNRHHNDIVKQMLDVDACTGYWNQHRGRKKPRFLLGTKGRISKTLTNVTIAEDSSLTDLKGVLPAQN